MSLRSLSAGLIICAAAIAAVAQAPTFPEFATHEGLKGPPAKPVLRTRTQKTFATQIRRQAVSPPNFAGHYKVAEWGCGSSCVSIAVIDLATGNVYDGPFEILGYAIPYRYEGGSDELEYRATSRLMIARGCPDDKNCGTYYYEWEGGHFHRLRFVPHGPTI